MLRRIEEQLDRLNSLMERMCALLEEERRTPRRRGKDANGEREAKG